jgi:hypothetical protein
MRPDDLREANTRQLGDDSRAGLGTNRSSDACR